MKNIGRGITQLLSKYSLNSKCTSNVNNFSEKKAAAITIQTHFRSFYARKNYQQNKQHDLNRKCLTYFSQQATLIQKVFRGYFVRKLIHNFYMRKQELKALEEKNQQFKEELEEYGKVQAMEAEQYQQELARA